MQKRSRDNGRSLGAYIAHVDVTCPRCSRHAQVRMLERRNENFELAFPGRLTCNQCGLVRTQPIDPNRRGYIVRADGKDPYFGVPLWLQTPTRHGLVIAYNAQHLEALENFVGAALRERNQDPRLGWHNKTMASRLQRWMKLAQNRDDMLAALARLRARLSQ